MAKICEICGKSKQIGNNRVLLRGHRNVTSKRTFKPNLQKIRHEGRRIWSCVQCMRTLRKDAKVPATITE